MIMKFDPVGSLGKNYKGEGYRETQHAVHG
jgi:hypothetical protein